MIIHTPLQFVCRFNRFALFLHFTAIIIIAFPFRPLCVRKPPKSRVEFRTSSRRLPKNPHSCDNENTLSLSCGFCHFVSSISLSLLQFVCLSPNLQFSLFQHISLGDFKGVQSKKKRKFPQFQLTFTHRTVIKRKLYLPSV